MPDGINLNNLNYSEELFDHVLNSVHSAVLITDENGVILAANPKIRDVFGYTDDALRGRELSILFTPEDMEFLYPNFLYLAEKCLVHEDEIMLLRRNKARFYAGVRFCGFRGQGRALNVFSITDIDKSKKMEKVFHQIGYNDLLKLANGMAHEIRNPLMGIGGQLRKLYKSCPVSVQDEEYYKYIYSNLKKIEAIVEKVEFFASMPEPVFDKTSLKEIIEQVVDEYDISAESGGEAISLELTDAEFVADSALLKRAMRILLSNAIDACSEDPAITLRAYPDNNSCRVIVSDNGRGISSNDLPYIFHPFYGTKPDGAGIDLAILKRIIESHNGTIQVQSKKREGTTFNIDIPMERRKLIRTNLLKDIEGEAGS